MDQSLGLQLTYAPDQVEAICTVLDSPSLPHDLYNMAQPGWITLKEVIGALRGAHPSVQVIEDPKKEIGRWKSRAESAVMDVSRLRTDTGFAARFDIASGVESYLQWREAFNYRVAGPGLLVS